MKWMSMSINTNLEQDAPKPAPLRSPGSTLRHYPNVTDGRSHPTAPVSEDESRSAPIGIPQRKNRDWINQGSFSGIPFKSSFGRAGSSPEITLSTSAPNRQTPPQLFSMISNLDRNG
eukprot:132758-Rhodomonas_salina.1